jgi:DNA-binding SARP family transcriptional activator/streptogramin lyase
LTERLAVEANGATLDEQRFPGRQGRILFAYLAAQNGRPVPRDELAELLWGEELPATWEKALRVLMTKLRGLLEECGIDGSIALTSAFGCYELTLPADASIDVDVAAKAVERAEAALAAEDLYEARAQASTAAELARGSFLPGEDGPWVEERRRDLRDVLVRALECLREVARAEGAFGEAVRYATEVTELEPFHESSYRALMQAHAGAGNPAEALRVYERCRRFLGDELGAYPSAESEAIYLEILRNSPKSSVADVDQLQIDGVPSTLPPRGVPPERKHHKLAVAAAMTAVLVAGAAVAAFVFMRGDEAPPVVLPSSVVRIDPQTLERTQVVPIGPRADLVVAAGGYVWITHGVLRHTKDEGLRDAGDRTLTRVDPATGDIRPVGQLAPCGLTADPSGDVWVANCYASGPGANVVRVDAKTLNFKPTCAAPTGMGIFRGMAYGGGSLWLADADDAETRRVTEVDPRTCVRHSIRADRGLKVLAWSEGYGDLWMDDFLGESVSRMRAETRGVTKTYDSVANNPGSLVVAGDAVWVGDWDVPEVVRLPAVGSGSPRHVALRVLTRPAGVTSVAAGEGAIWATVPDDHALWRIDRRTEEATRIPLRYFPWGVAVGDDGIWVTVRARDAA